MTIIWCCTLIYIHSALIISLVIMSALSVLIILLVHIHVKLVSCVKLGVLEKQSLTIILRQLPVNLLSLVVLPPSQNQREVGNTSYHRFFQLFVFLIFQADRRQSICLLV